MMMPVFPDQDGVFVGRYLRHYIHNAAGHSGAPRLTEDDVAALDALDAISEREGMALEMTFAPGDIQLINNNGLFHGRTAFEDDDDAGQRRLLLRIWLSHASSRKLPDSFRDLYAETAAGAYRGGIWPRNTRSGRPRE